MMIRFSSVFLLKTMDLFLQVAAHILQIDDEPTLANVLLSMACVSSVFSRF